MQLKIYEIKMLKDDKGNRRKHLHEKINTSNPDIIREVLAQTQLDWWIVSRTKTKRIAHYQDTMEGVDYYMLLTVPEYVESLIRGGALEITI